MCLLMVLDFLRGLKILLNGGDLMEAFSIFFGIGSGLGAGLFLFLFLPIYFVMRKRR